MDTIIYSTWYLMGSCPPAMGVPISIITLLGLSSMIRLRYFTLYIVRHPLCGHIHWAGFSSGSALDHEVENPSSWL